MPPGPVCARPDGRMPDRQAPAGRITSSKLRSRLVVLACSATHSATWSSMTRFCSPDINGDPQLMSGLQNRVMEDQVAEWVAEHANTTNLDLSFDEVMRPAGA